MSFSPSNQPFKDDIELKSDLRSDTLDTRQEYDLKVSSHRFTEMLVYIETGSRSSSKSKQIKRLEILSIGKGYRHRCRNK